MRVIVVGAGVIGMATAYYLARRDCEVVVIDRLGGAGAGTSFANGGQLSYTYSDSLARPEFIARIPRLLAGFDDGARIRPDAGFLSWGLRFLLQCTRSRAESNTVTTLKNALRSAELMDALRDDIDFDFCFRSAGKMIVLDDDESLEPARRMIRLKAPYGSDNVLLSYTESAEVEPAIAEFRQRPVASVYSKGDDVGDARSFATGMQAFLEQRYNVSFQLDESVRDIAIRRGRATGVITDVAGYEADAVVTCAGVWTNQLLDGTGVRLPIYPMRGYSVTLPVGSAAPSVSVTSNAHHFVFSRLNGHMRIAGFADFQGFDQDNDDKRIDTLLETARRVGPDAADYEAEEQHRWGAFRPMTPDGQPTIGATRLPGLFVNAGHGMLGWTLACYSGERAASEILGDQTSA